MDTHLQAPFGNERLDAEGCLRNILHHITTGNAQLQFARLRLARLKYLLQQPYHALYVQLH